MDATKLHANASPHSALSYGHAEKIEAQLQGEVAELLARAEAADAEPLHEGLNHAYAVDATWVSFARFGHRAIFEMNDRNNANDCGRDE